MIKLSTGEKILSIHINEYNSLKELQEDFLNLPKEMSINGKKLNNSKKEALIGLQYQLKHFHGKAARQFYYKKTRDNKVDYFQLYELIID